MNIEIANRLLKLRKEKGYSQEELADKLGLSRQAISKWERAESSPDTDNLIMLAKLYDMSLDDLLNTDEPTEEIKQRVEDQNNNENVEGIKINQDGIAITDDEGQTLKLENGHFHCYDKDGNLVKKENPDIVGCAIGGIVAISSLVAYIILGFTVEYGWVAYWTLLLLVPIIGSIYECIKEKQLSKFAYPILIVAIYCFLGLRFPVYSWKIGNATFYGFWHPLWVMFLTIPVFYIITNLLDIYVFKTKEKDKDECECSCNK